MPEISIVIPTLGTSPSLPVVIGALNRQQPQPRAEVLVVVDAHGSVPRGLDEFSSGQSLQPKVFHARHKGASAARNAGWRSADAPLILFLDDDVVPERQLVAEHLAWHRRWPEREVGVLGTVRWSPLVMSLRSCAG
jgi:glycosyltransferase involved in cell wall biosynthesis